MPHDSPSTTEALSRRESRGHYRPDIEGLRAVAVLAVVLFHAEVPGLSGGFIGVDVFFVISGFLITGLLWREATTTGTVRLRNFYGARARRLLPASAFVGVITRVASAALLPPLQARTVAGDGIASALYVSNYRFLLQGVDYSAPSVQVSPFLHYWSLGVEEQFYLVWPALILGTAWLIRLTRRRTRIQALISPRPYLIVLALVVAGSFALSLAACHWAPAAAFFSLPTRAWQLGAGALVALTTTRWQRLSRRAAVITGWTGLALILLSCNIFSEATLYPGVAALVPTLGTVLVIGAGCATPSQGCGWVLGASPMRAIGRISYSWYLWHWPVLVLAPALLGHPLGLAARLAGALLSGALAVLTLRLIENPLRFATPIHRSAKASLTLGGGVTAAAVAAGLVLLVAVPAPLGHGTPAAPLTINAAPAPPNSDLATHDAAVRQAFSQVQAAVTASADLKAVPSNLTPPLADAAAELADMFSIGCMRSAWQVDQPDCATGDTASPTTVAVIGDSHAAMWNPAFHEVAQQRHWRLEMMTKAGCPMTDLPIFSDQLHREYTECEQWRGQILTRLRAEHPRLVVIAMWRGYYTSNDPAARTESYDQAWIDSLTRLVRQLRDTGANVMVFAPTPEAGSVVPVCLSGHLDDTTACAQSRAAAVNENGIAVESRATEGVGGHYADLTDLFCTSNRCPVIVGNTLVYIDRAHVTIEYCRLLAPAIGALADRALAHS